MYVQCLFWRQNESQYRRVEHSKVCVSSIPTCELIKLRPINSLEMIWVLREVGKPPQVYAHAEIEWCCCVTCGSVSIIVACEVVTITDS